MTTTYKKNFIGKGKQVGTMEIIKVVIPIEAAEGAVFEKDGVKYLGFEVAKMQNPDKFERTHTVYFTTRENTPTVADPLKKQPSTDPEDDLPF